MPDSTATVLLVEDNPGDARLIELTLEEHGGERFRLERVASLSDALDRLASGGVDVILLDLTLPDSEGLDTFRRIDRSFPSVPVVVLTGLDDEPTALRAMQDGAQDYLVKRTGGPGEVLARSLLYAIERKRAEEALRQAKRIAESANRTKSHLVAVVTHEIRSPASTILGFAELLGATPLDAEQREMLRHVTRAASTLVELTRDLHDAAAEEVHPRPLRSVAFDLPALVEEAGEALALTAREKGLSLECTVAPGVPKPVCGDPDRLRQVLVNLATNAIKFTEHGCVRIEAKPAGAPHAVRFSVSDTGIGIPASKRQTIFEPFVQGDESIRTRFGGAGLGLPIARSLVERMGGELTVESEEGRGSTFAFTIGFPNGAGRTASPETRVETSAEPRILVVDDSDEIRTIVARFLRETPTVLDVARDGEEAVRMFREREYDLVLMDVEMPGTGGREATARIRAWEREGSRSPTPIVAMTAYVRHGAPTGDGWTGHLTKPFSKRDLLQVVRAHAGGRAAGDPAESPRP